MRDLTREEILLAIKMLKGAGMMLTYPEYDGITIPLLKQGCDLIINQLEKIEEKK